MLEASIQTKRAREAHQPTANDRFKQRSSRWFWGSLTAATLVHFGVFAFMPGFTPPAMGQGGQHDIEVLSFPDIDIPDLPPPIPTPALPVIGTTDVGPDVTIPSTRFQDHPASTLPPPPSQASDVPDTPTLTPYTLAPELRNKAEVAQALMRYYPPMLRDAGISGTVKVWFFIDADGRVVRTRVNVSSGYEAFDAAAVKVAKLMRFRPAQNMDRKVPVWVSIPIVFQIQ